MREEAEVGGECRDEVVGAAEDGVPRAGGCKAGWNGSGRGEPQYHKLNYSKLKVVGILRAFTP